MATTLTSAELQRLRNMFEELDVDDSGELELPEFRKLMRVYKEWELKEFWRHLGQSKNRLSLLAR